MVRKFMHASDAFERMKKRAEGLDVPRTFKTEIAHKLEYFKMQSLCDLDRRDKERVIRERWEEFENQTRGSGLFESCRLDHSLWPEVLAFIGVQDSKYVPEKKWAPPSRVKHPPISRFDKWTATDFFRHLKNKISGTKDLPPGEKNFLKVSVNFLFAETLLPRSNRERDTVAVKETWKLIWPLLDKHKLLDEYREDQQLRSRVEFFLKDGF